MLADRWCNWKEDEPCPFTADDLKTFIPEQIEEFCALLLEKAPISINKLKLMNELYNMNSFKNNEIKFR